MTARLGYLLKKFPRLSETFVLDEILGQEELGRVVQVFARREPDVEPRHPQLARLRAAVDTLPPSREIDPWTPLFAAGKPRTGLVRRVGTLVEEAAAEWSHPRFPSLLSEAIELLPRVRRAGVGHLHVHFATDSAIVAMLLRRLGGPTYSITAHAKDIYRSTVAPALLDRLFTGAELVVTVCDANVRYLAQRLSTAAMSRVRRLYNGLDLTAFPPPSADAPRDEDHVLAVGRLVAKKGLPVFLEALARLRGAGRRVRATLVGDGEERENLVKRIVELGLGDRVRMTGALDRRGVRELMARATLFCLPCQVGPDGNRDALPTVLLEALACGLPAVSTPVTGIPEILDGGRAGLLVPEGDAAATASAMARLLDDSALRRRLANRGRRRVEQVFDLRRSAATLGAWFDAALAPRRMRCAS